MDIATLHELFQKSSGISTDTRSIQPGNIFFALKGEHFNGNLYTEQALRSGALYAVTEESRFQSEKIITVQNVLTTLQQLANYHRKKLKPKVIVIAGSNGKTTTKELISRVLQTTFRTFSTKGNLNNHIGVPLSLLSINNDTEFAVIETGANHLGETKLLCEIAEPDYGLITNNGKDHLEGYGSLENVKKGNGELYEFLEQKLGLAFVSADQKDLLAMSATLKRITYGSNKTADCRGELVGQHPFLQIQALNTNFSSQLIGKYNFENVMAAICIGKYFDVPLESIRKAVESYSPSNNRSQILKVGTNTFILDAYNANPSSMEAALDSFSSLPVENKILVLGDMAELGSSSEEEHREVLKKIENACLPDRQGKWKMVILVGDEFGKVKESKNLSFLHFKNVSELKPWFQEQSFQNCFFLFKASRVIGLEKLIAG